MGMNPMLFLFIFYSSLMTSIPRVISFQYGRYRNGESGVLKIEGSMQISH
jgi:hypothetical protein